MLFKLFLLAAAVRCVVSGDSASKCIGQKIGYKVLDETNCNCYILCGGTFVTRKHCQSSQVFNELTQACINGTCIPGLAATMPCGCDTEPPTDCGCPNGRTDIVCPTEPIPPNNGTSGICAPNKHGDRFPHETDCRLFWECVEGTAVLRFCEKGTWWDRERFVCDFEKNVTNCKHK